MCVCLVWIRFPSNFFFVSKKREDERMMEMDAEMVLPDSVNFLPSLSLHCQWKLIKTGSFLPSLSPLLPLVEEVSTVNEHLVMKGALITHTLVTLNYVRQKREPKKCEVLEITTSFSLSLFSVTTTFFPLLLPSFLTWNSSFNTNFPLFPIVSKN